MVNWVKSKFQIGKYIALEYADTVLLKKTEGHDIQKLREMISNENATLVNLPLSRTAKTSIIQNTISEILEQTSEQEVLQVTLIEKLVNSGKFNEKDAVESVEKALKIGALSMTKPGYVGL